MYTRQEASQLRQSFWTTFGKYMSPVPSVEGLSANWLNYKTGEKHIRFKMDAGRRVASIGIEITQTEPGLRQLYFEQFTQLKVLLFESLQEEWTWSLYASDETGRPISRIYQELAGISVFDQSQWGLLISFFKPRIIALDRFWSSARYAFEALR